MKKIVAVMAFFFASIMLAALIFFQDHELVANEFGSIECYTVVKGESSLSTAEWEKMISENPPAVEPALAADGVNSGDIPAPDSFVHFVRFHSAPSTRAEMTH